MTEALGTASGKIILLGEHAVVYGAPAIAAGLAERGARARATRASGASALWLGGRMHAASPGGSGASDAAKEPATSSGPNGDGVARAFAALLEALLGAGPVHVEAESDLPPGGGLGSSAALGVAIARAITALAPLGPPAEPPPAEAAGAAGAGPAARVRAAAAAWEAVFHHGRASGIDLMAAATSGCFRFTRAEGATLLPARDDLWLCVGSTGTSHDTGAMIELVARHFQRKPDLAERSIAGITSLVNNAALAIEAGDATGLGRLMDLNHMILAGMFVSNEAIEALCRLAREAGALGAKLTGAGGGGSVIALLPPPPPGGGRAPEAAERVLAAWRGAGYSGFVTRIEARATRAAREEQA
ncbi:mevalonate kinase [Sorangium sp. So ce131]|uniref:mevalonate kinase n=1 Tax=Sorangium sp. So ce131 TaxID=3133282 RepID=UPI003F6025C3